MYQVSVGILILLILTASDGCSSFFAKRTDQTPQTETVATPSTASATSVAVDAVYQQFEYGFMVGRTDEDCVYAYSSVENNIVIPSEIDNIYHYCLEYNGLPTVVETSEELSSPEAVLHQPMGVVGRVWSYYPAIREMLGLAMGPEVHYSGHLPNTITHLNGSPLSLPVVPLPDGTVLYCGTRAATAGQCNIQNN